MIKVSLGLRAKVLLGSLLLVIPLAVALTVVYRYGSAEITTAQNEALGVTAMEPVWNAIYEWQIRGRVTDSVTSNLQDFTALMAGDAKSLAPETDATAGASWQKPEALADAAKQADGSTPEGFAQFHKALISDIVLLSDHSGLVLDSDLDSYYLILALYQTVPNMLEKLTDLKPLFGTEVPKLSDKDRLLLYSRARELSFQASYLTDQVGRSVRAQAANPVVGYAASMDIVLKAVSSVAAAIQDNAGPPALGGAFDSATIESKTLALLSSLRTFQAEGTKALKVMLARRLSEASLELITSFVWAGLGLAVGGTLMLLVVGGIRRRVFTLMGSLGSLAAGDLTLQVPGKLLASKDEVGRLAGSVKKLQADLKAQVVGIGTVANDLAQIGSTLGSTAEQSSAAIEQMSAITSTVAHAAESQAGQTEKANGLVADMVAGIAQSNDLTQGMATQFFLFSQSMEANRNRIRETAAEAQTTGQLAQGLDRTGDQGEQSVAALKKSIGGVVDKTGQIQEIVQLILDIADRTNLLSMNAAIEAAHAGAAGRGFSIVADEIRKLAEVSAKQAQTIQGILDSITGVVERSLTDSEATAQSFQRLRLDITTVKNASSNIAEKMAAQEAEDEALSNGLHKFAEFYSQLSEALDKQIDESKGVSEVLGSLQNSSREISHSMQEQKIGMEQSTEASIQVRETALNLSQVLGVLEAQVSRFKT